MQQAQLQTGSPPGLALERARGMGGLRRGRRKAEGDPCEGGKKDHLPCWVSNKGNKKKTKERKLLTG